MSKGSDVTDALDRVLVAAGFAAGQGVDALGIDGDPIGITYCAGHDDLSDRFPWLPQAEEYPRGERACIDLVIGISSSGVVERVDLESLTLGETLTHVGQAEDARIADGFVGQPVSEVLDVLPNMLARLFSDRD